MRTILLVLATSLGFNAHAVSVNRLNGSAGIVYIDFSLPGAVLPLELARTYNSITAASEQKGWLGAFGWGWTSPFETTLTTTPDRNVLLRDGGNGNTILFRPEKEDPKVMSSFLEELKQVYFEAEKGRKLSHSELTKINLPERIVAQIKSDPDFRNEMAAKYGIKTEIPLGQVLISSEYGYQTVFQRNNQWIRQRDGVTQVFDTDGRLVRQIDKNGFYFDFTYSKNQKFQLEQIHDANRTMSLRFKWRGDRIVEVVDNKGNKSLYSYDSASNLVQATDSNRQTYRYSYENRKYPHLLTRIDYVSESQPGQPVRREIRYDDNALVILHKDKDGSETTYSYGKIARDPENNFWTKSVRVEGKTKEEIYDEYMIKARPDGTKFLYKQMNKSIAGITNTTYTACCGKPSEQTRNGVTTSYKYYSNGLLKERVGPKEDVKIDYDPRWKKVSRVSQNGVVSEYAYDDRGNLVRATNSRKEKVTLKYDKHGRILEMVDTAGKAVTFNYGDLGKPILIAQAGVGAIKIDYDKQGRIKNAQTVGDGRNRTPSKESSKDVVRKVMRSFQQLLDIIRPAGIGMNLG